MSRGLSLGRFRGGGYCRAKFSFSIGASCFRSLSVNGVPHTRGPHCALSCRHEYYPSSLPAPLRSYSFVTFTNSPMQTTRYPLMNAVRELYAHFLPAKRSSRLPSFTERWTLTQIVLYPRTQSPTPSPRCQTIGGLMS